MASGVWNSDLDSRVTELYKTMSAAQIIAELAKDRLSFTRSAIQGRLHRLGVTASTKACAHPNTPLIRAPQVRAAKQPPVGSVAFKVINAIKKQKAGPDKAPRPFVCQSAAGIEPLQISLQDFTKDTCKYECSNQPDAAAFTFCGHQTLPGMPWCAGHAVIVFKPLPQRRAA